MRAQACGQARVLRARLNPRGRIARVRGGAGARVRFHCGVVRVRGYISIR